MNPYDSISWKMCCYHNNCQNVLVQSNLYPRAIGIVHIEEKLVQNLIRVHFGSMWFPSITSVGCSNEMIPSL